MNNYLNALIAQGRPAPPIDFMSARRNALALRAAEEEVANLPEERNWLREKRAMEKAEFGWKEREEQRKLDWEPFTDEITAAEGLTKIIPHLNESNWDAAMKHLATVKRVNKSILTPLATLKAKATSEGVPPEQFPAWLENYKLEAVHGLDLYKARTERAKAEKPDLSSEAKKYRDYLQLSDLINKGQIRTKAQIKQAFANQGIEATEEDIDAFVQASFNKDKTALDKIFGLIEKPKDYEPHLFILPNRKQVWVNPGEDPPRGAVPYEKPTQEKSPTEFDKKFELSRQVAKERLRREPTLTEVVDTYKSKFGVAGLLELFGLGSGGAEAGPGSKPIPKF